MEELNLKSAILMLEEQNIKPFRVVRKDNGYVSADTESSDIFNNIEDLDQAVLQYKILDSIGIVLVNNPGKKKAIFSICKYYKDIPYVVTPYYDFETVDKITSSLKEINERQETSFAHIDYFLNNSTKQRVSYEELLGTLNVLKIPNKDVFSAEKHATNPLKFMLDIHSDMYLKDIKKWIASSFKLTSLIYSMVDKNILLENEYMSLANMLLYRTVDNRRRDALSIILKAPNKVFEKLDKLIKVLEDESISSGDKDK